jgi:HAD superfamily phosphoserine phosphatase-like hydrolase
MKKTKVAIFDIDGTIFRKNLHFELINELVWLKVFPLKVRKTLTDLYSSWLSHEGTYDEYRLALVDLYAKHIAGHSPEDVRRASEIVIPFHKRRTYIFAEHLMKKLREENYFLAAISGSPIEIVEEYNRRYLHFDRVLGSVYEIDKEGRYTGNAAFEPTKNKGLAAKQLVYENHLTLEGSYGIGDTESDASLLDLVEHPIVFNPNQNLKKIAEEKGWRIVVEKKDVVYELA